MSRFFYLTVFLLITFYTNTLLATPTSDFTREHDPRQVSTYLYAQVGSRATMKPIKDKKHWYKLTLHDINDNTLWFTSHPIRQNGSITIQHFVRQWKADQIDRFAKKNINATLVSFFVVGGKREQHSMTLRLMNPSYDAESKSLSYEVKFFPRENPQLLAEQPFYDAALFIDNLSFSN